LATVFCLVPALVACTTATQQQRAVQDNIRGEMQQAAAPRQRAVQAPPPAVIADSLLPPLRTAPVRPAAREMEQRFNLKVSDAPIGQVLLAVVQDTPYSILLSPRTAVAGTAVGGPPGTVVASAPPPIPERLTVNLKDVTVFEALDAIREIYGYEYVVDGTRIYVHPPEMRTKLYQVNYVNGQRRGVSDVQVIGGASTSSSSSSGGGTGGTGGSGSSGSGSTGAASNYASIQASALSSMSRADIWGEMEDSLRTILGCTIPSVAGRAATTGGGSSTGGTAGSGSNSSRADVSFAGEGTPGARQRGVEGCPGGRAMTVNSMSGTVIVRAMPTELRQIDTLLRSLQLTIERQVIIEAKVIDVELNAGSQQGINWSGLQRGLFRGGVGANPNLVDATGNPAFRGTITPGATLGDLLGTSLLGNAVPNAFTAGVGVAIQATNFSALINFLETQGNVQVLSSPRIATLNNQKAVLKVGSEESFVTNISGGSSTITNGTAQTVPPTLSYQPFFSGISLDVTPQIDENDNITLHVRTMVNSIAEKEKLAIPAANSTRVPFAVNSISETDSVVKTKDGQVVVIGGLMTESASSSRAGLPVAGDVPVVGALFGKGNRQSAKRELVILLKPTVVMNDDSWAGDINAAQGRIEKMMAPVAPRPLQ
jgi:MSHA biogenesis protein MshL